MPATVEALERMGRSLWLRCMLAVVQSLTAHIPGTVIYPGQQEIPNYLPGVYGEILCKCISGGCLSGLKILICELKSLALLSLIL